MQDQVEALERVAPGRVALVNAQQDAATNRRAVERAVARARAAALRRARALRLARLPRAHPARRGSACSWSTRRTASPSGGTTSGPTTSGSPTRRAGSAREAIVASTATATPQVAADIVARLGLRDPVRVATGFDRPNLSFAVVPCATKEAAHRGIAAALARAGRAAGDRLRGHARGVRPARRRGSARELGVRGRSPTTRACRATRARRRSGASWPARRRSSWPPTRSAWASTRPTCGRSATSRVPGSLEAYYQEAGRAGRDGAAGALPAVRHGARQGPARVLHRALDGRRGRAAGASRGGSCGAADGRRRRATTSRCDELARVDGATRRRVRAIVGHLARAGVVQPAPSPPDRVIGPGRRRVGRRALARLPHGRAGGHARRAGASTARCGRGSRATRCRREGILRHFGDRSAPAPHGPVLRRLRSRRSRPRRRRRPRAPRRPRSSRAAAASRRRSTRRSSTSSRARRARRSAARARSRSCAAGARR